jgi:phospholipase C
MGLSSLALLQLSCGMTLAATSADTTTRSPIKHVIVIIGENRSFDHVFATYVPKKGEKVWNLLSEGIVNKDGTPGPNFAKAEQLQGYATGRRRVSPEPGQRILSRASIFRRPGRRPEGFVHRG